jgi:hypothetical protein
MSAEHISAQAISTDRGTEKWFQRMLPKLYKHWQSVSMPKEIF